MKKLLVCLSLLLLNASFANAQHFIDADLIRTARLQKSRALINPNTDEKKGIFLPMIVGSDKSASDVIIGFDETEYAYGENIVVTLKREPSSQSPDSLVVFLYSSDAIIDGSNNMKEMVMGRNETRRITVSNLKASTGLGNKAHISVQAHELRRPMWAEQISFQIYIKNYPQEFLRNNSDLIEGRPMAKPSHNGIPSKFTIPDSVRRRGLQFASEGSLNERTTDSKETALDETAAIFSNDPSSASKPLSEKQPETTVNINVSGIIKFTRNSGVLGVSPGVQGVQRWLLTVYQADTEFEANNPTSSTIFNEYSIVGNSSGSYNATFSVTKQWYSVSIAPIRRTGVHDDYIGITITGEIGGVIEGSVFELLFEAVQQNITNINLNYTFAWITDPITYDQKIDEGIRRCYEIGYKLDNAMAFAESNNLKINNNSIASAQTVLIFASGMQMINDTYASVYDATAKENIMVIGYENYYQSDGVVLHEYGHTLQFTMNNFSLYPEQGGLHYMDGNGHPNNAFSEGWANYWACAVTNKQLYNEGLTNFQLNLGTSTASYIYSQQPSASSYLPNSITQFDGVENEAMVASALWQLKSSNNNLAVWNGMLASYNSRKPRNMMEYFAASSSLQTAFYNSGRALNLGFGSRFISLNATDNLQNQVNTLLATERPLIYLTDGTYNVSPQLAIGEKTVGIYGMSSKSTIIRGIGSQNVIQIANRANNNDWLKLADLQITNGNFGIDAGFDGAGATGQPRVAVNRSIVRASLRGMCFAGDVILRNNVINFSAQAGVGVMLISSGATRKVYLYNNVLDNCTPSILFRNRNSIEGRMGNNILNSVTSFGLASLAGGGSPVLPTSISFTNNGLLTTAPSGYVNSSSSYIGSPNFVSANFFNPQNSQYPDGGIQIASYDPIFNDRSKGIISGQSGSGQYNYGTSNKNWVGLYGGQTAYFGGTSLLPASVAEPLAIEYSVLEHDVWGGAVEILDSNVTVKSGATLTILPNTTISLAAGKRIIVEPGAKLIANGNFDSPIVFKRKDASQAWDKLALYGDSCQFSYCTFDGGTYNAAVYGRGMVFNNCVFKNGWVGNDSYWAATGVRSSFTMNACSFQNNRVGAIVSYADAILSNCTIQNNTSVGLYLWNSTATTDWAAVQNNVTDANEGNRGGVELRNASVLNFEPNKYNRIWNNRSHEVYLDQPSRLYAGSSSSSRGNNSIKDVVNGYNADGYYIHNYTLSIGYEDEELVWTLPAQYNYWGGAPNAGMFLGAVDYSNPLSSDPTDMLPQRAKDNGEKTKELAKSDDFGILPIDTTKVDVNEWIALKQRMAALRTSIGQNEHRKVGVKMLGELYALMTFDRDNKTGERDQVDALLSKWSSRLKRHIRGSAAGEAEIAISFGGEASMVAEIDAQLKRENYTEALTKLNDYEGHILNKDHKAICLMSRLALQERAGNYVAALQTVQTLKSLVPDNGLANHYDAPSYDIVEARLNDLIGNGSPTVPNVTVRNAQTESLKKIPETFVLTQNYPNPFNPVTLIRYQLPTASNVKLQIFDVLGRVVTTLVNERKDAGIYEVPFNASTFASGAYFYRLQAGSFVQTKKMVLIK